MRNQNHSPSQARSPFPLPQLSEDALHYIVHLPSSSDADPSATALLITDYINSLLPQPWIWNKDSWELKLYQHGPGLEPIGGEDQGISMLEGHMRVGDAVDDEWLVVWLLKQVSEKWPEFIISIRDTDGEFLLIEAANELPSWISPDNAENRLWLSNGRLHLLPLTVHSPTPPHQLPDSMDVDSFITLTVSDALEAVREGNYFAPEKVEGAVWNRIKGYPQALSTHLHHAKMYLPIVVVKALHKRPELIQRAVEAFYVRDPSQLRAVSRMTNFPPSTAVLTLTTLTRAAYAQLQGQVFHPPRIFGPEWNTREPSDGVEATAKKLENERRWRDLGVKVTIGFEIMYREGGKKNRTGATQPMDSKKDAEYQGFLEKLKQAGWFGNEVQGSQKWKEREEQALTGYMAVKPANVVSSTPSFAYLVDTAISDCSPSEHELSVLPDTPEDDNSWLEVDPHELDGMMMSASGQSVQEEAKYNNRKTETGEEHGKALGDLAKKVQEFVGGQGDIEGARFLDELSDEEMDTDSQGDSEEEQYRQELEQTKQERIDNLIPGISAEDWGRKTQPIQFSQDQIKAQSSMSTSLDNKTPHTTNPLDSIPSTMRPPIFAKQEFDGVESDSSDEDEENLPPAGTWGRKIGQMKWSEFPDVEEEAKIEEIYSDDEEKQESKREKNLGLGSDKELEEEMRHRVWGYGDENEGEDTDKMDARDVDIEDETEEFLQFSRKALGISNEMWEGILSERRAKGAYVPPEASNKPEPKADYPPAKYQSSAESKVQFANEGRSLTNVEEPSFEQSNSSLNSFDAVMKAMDEALSRSRTNQSSTLPPPAGQKASKLPVVKKAASSGNPLPPKPQNLNSLNEQLEDFNEDDLAAMDRELRSVLKGAGVDPDDDDELDIEEARELEGDDKKEYEMMRDFLESYRSQGGGSGVVGNLFGRFSGGK
ncbi:hypothetical protein L204_102466 [Cryptococcus depauperatus]|nr:hypothetical protein L204_00787 [Cryptococcus depauperatus CBS 7855]